MTRREFLKRMYGFTVGLFALYVLRTLSIFTKTSEDRHSRPLKKAQFYRRSDRLAG